MKSITLFLSLFLCEAIPTFVVARHVYADDSVIFLSISFLAISLLFSWFFADKNEKLIKNIGYIGMFGGLFYSLQYFGKYEPAKGLLIAVLSMLIGANISFRERRMLAYLLLLSFMLFLYGSSVVYDKYSLPSVVFFTFSFFTVVIADYYNSRVKLQNNYSYESPNSFFMTAFLLVIVASGFTAILYYLLPQPKALHYGILPFGGSKKYRGVEGEGDIKSKNYKANITQLPKYTPSGKSVKSSKDSIKFYNDKDSATIKKDKNSASKERELKKRNKKAYYSSLYTILPINKNLSNVIFEVKGKEARFLRGETYAYFDGKDWKKIDYLCTIKKGNKYARIYWNGKGWQGRIKPFVINDLCINEYFTKKRDNYTIIVKGKLAGRPIIYMPTGLLRLQFPSDTFYEDSARTIYAPSQLEVGTFYTAAVESKKYYGYDTLSFADVWYKKAYSKVGYDIDQRIPKLADKLTKNWNTPLEKAEAIIKYFKTNYLYKHSSIKDKMQNQTLSKMLFKSKIGNALQFNTALIMMLRSVGVYARLVTGYAPDEYDQKRHSYIVERKNRAVWTEFFVKGVGWVAINAADDIPFEGENEGISSDELLSNKVQFILLGVSIFILFLIFLYLIRVHIWTYIAKYRIEKYMKKGDIDFVISSYKEVERYYRHFKRGQKQSCTIQEYENYIKNLKPEITYPMEYLSFYSNQAIYKGELDSFFDKEKYLNIALKLVDKPFKTKSKRAISYPDISSK